MTIAAVKTLDPVTVEIIRNALTGAADDMNATLIRSAYSPILYEGGDCVVALLDTDHRVLGQSAGLPLFLGNLETCSIAVEETVRPRRSGRKGTSGSSTTHTWAAPT